MFRRLSCLLLLAIIALTACRGTRPEAGLESKYFEGEFPRLASDVRGFWYLVLAEGQPLSPWVTIGDEKTRKLFFALPKGERTVQLLPVSPHAYSFLDQYRDQRVDATLSESLQEIEVTDPVGLWDGKSLRWLGPAPQGEHRVVLASTALPEEEFHLGSWLQGVARLSGDTLEEATATAEEPLFVLPDQIASDRPLRAGVLDERLSPDVAGIEFEGHDHEVRPELVMRYYLQPLGRRLQSDLLVLGGPSGPVIFATEPALHRDLELAVTEVPLTVRGEGDDALNSALRGLAAAINGHPLSAYYWLSKAGVAVGDNETAGRLRVLELAGAGGYVDWARHSILREAKGLDADAAIYLARAHALGGDLARADDFAQRARKLFYSWYAPQSELGIARADRFLAWISNRQGSPEVAVERGLRAAKRFGDAGDHMAAAETELELSAYAFAAGMQEQALKAASLARSRFYHGNSPYYSAFAEMRLADLYTRYADPTRAQEMAHYAVLRLQELDDSVSANRAQITRARARSETSRGSALRELTVAFDKARDLHDVVGALDAASTIVTLDLPRTPQTLATYGLAISRGLGHTSDLLLRERARRALAALCDANLSEVVAQQSLGTEAELRVRAACHATSHEDLAESSVETLLKAGYQHLQRGRLEEARDVAQKAREMLDEDLRQSAPMDAARILFYEAALARATGSDAAEGSVSDGLELLRKSIDPAQQARTLSQMSEEFTSRGHAWLAGELAEAAVNAAGAQGQGELQRELAMKWVRVLHGAAAWDGTLEAIRVSEPIAQGAGPSAATHLAPLLLYRADVLHRIGRGADAKLAHEQARQHIAKLDADGQLGAELLAADLALDRGDAGEASEHLTRAATLEKGLTENLAGTEKRKLYQAEIGVLKGRLAALSGRYDQAFRAFRGSDELLVDNPDAAARRLRVQALAGAASVAPSVDEVEAVSAQLESLRSEVEDQDPDLQAAASLALAELAITSGQSERALSLLEDVHGNTGELTRTDPVCLRGRAAVLAGNRKDGAQLLEQCQKRGGLEEQVEARLLLALSDSKGGAADKAKMAEDLVAEHGMGLPARERERLRLVAELAQPTQQADARKDGSLRRALEDARSDANSARIAKATTALADYLVDTGRADEAAKVVDENSTAFYDAEPESPGELVRLRVRTLVHQLRAVEALNYAYRAVSETPDLAPGTEAKLSLLVAQNDLALGLWQHAQQSLGDAAASAASARDRQLQQRVRELAKRFSLPLSE